MTVMASMIGLQIAGRNPGFELWLSIGWSGENLKDISEKKLSTSDVYHSVKLDSEYWTYELLVCNFIPGDGRDDAITHIGLRIPARTEIVDSTGRKISPADILAKVRDALVANNFKRRALSYELDRSKAFDPAVYSPFIAGLGVRPIWGPAMSMTGDMPAFINADSATLAAKIEHLPLCSRLSQASVVNLGGFLPEVPLFTMTDDELASEPSVRVCVACRNGEERISDLGAGKTFNSADFGYSPVAYTNVAVQLTRAEVLDAFVKGRGIVRSGATVKLDGRAGDVFVVFAPTPVQTDFIVELEGLAAGDSKEAVRGELSLDSRSLSSGAFPLCGEQISEFRSAVARDPKYLLKHLHVKPASAYDIKDAELCGDTLKIVLKPHTAPASSALRKGKAAGTAVLTILAPAGAKWASKACPIEIRQTPIGHNTECDRISSDYHPEVHFEVKEGRPVAHLGFTPEPSSRIVVLAGVPERIVAEAMQDAPGGGTDRYVADLSGSRAETRSVLSRFGGLFAFRDGERLPVSWFAARVLALLFAFIVVVAGGMLAGWHYSEGIDRIFGVGEATAQVQQAGTGTAEVNTEAATADSKTIGEDAACRDDSQKDAAATSSDSSEAEATGSAPAATEASDMTQKAESGKDEGA